MQRFAPWKLVEARKAAGLNQTELAARLLKISGTTQTQVSRWENGQTPRKYVIAALAKALGVSAVDLYEDVEDEEAAALMPPFRQRDEVDVLRDLHVALGRILEEKAF